MTKEEVLVAILLAYLATEFTEFLGWLAAKIAALSARLRYGDTERGRNRAEELATMVRDERPVQILKLVTALGLLASGLYFAGLRRAADLKARRSVPSTEKRSVSSPEKRMKRNDFPARAGVWLSMATFILGLIQGSAGWTALVVVLAVSIAIGVGFGLAALVRRRRRGRKRRGRF